MKRFTILAGVLLLALTFCLYVSFGSPVVGAEETTTTLSEEPATSGELVETTAAELSEEEIQAIVAEVIAANPQTIEQYKGGKTNVLGFLVGQCMKASKGKGNPELLRELILKVIEA